MANKKIKGRVKRIRQWMCEERVEALVVPTMDPHNGEYLPEHYKARQWLTGFTGSAGVAVVTADAAALWTDSLLLASRRRARRHAFRAHARGHRRCAHGGAMA